MRESDAMCTSTSPMRSTASTCSSLEEALRLSTFPADPFGLPTPQSHETRALATSNKIPRFLWRCSFSARTLLSRTEAPTVRSSSVRRHTYGALLSSITTETHRMRETPQSSTVLLRESSDDLQLFREEAEYSDYLSAHVTGQHERHEDGIVFYQVQVHLSKQQWHIIRRFSEFRALRRQLIQHFSRSKRRRPQRCAICASVLASIIETIFPSRRVWGSHFFSSSFPHVFKDEIIDERIARFHDFVAMCLLTVRSLRQHVRVLPDSSMCEINVALRMIEEFLGLSFTRYLCFLGERGIVDQLSRERLSLRRRQEHRAVSDIGSNGARRRPSIEEQ